jgi:hypothetical protein
LYELIDINNIYLAEINKGKEKRRKKGGAAARRPGRSLARSLERLGELPRWLAVPYTQMGFCLVGQPAAGCQARGRTDLTRLMF